MKLLKLLEAVLDLPYYIAMATNLKDILDLLSSPSKEDIELVTKAYSFAEKAHAEQKRFSGEPYFVHCLETAKILAELGMSATTVSAGFLHDTLEDAGVKNEELEKEFSKEILFLVQGVTKLGGLKYHGVDRHNESLRKFFVATSEDLRVLIIKFADRLHNMRTLEFVPEKKQKRIARETLEIYAPIAYRLGIRKLNRELEDLAFPYVYPEEYKWVKGLLKERSESILHRLEKFQKSIRKALAEGGETKIRTDYRMKGLYSLYRKLLRKEKDIEKIHDIAALRIIVPTTSDCYKVFGIIHSTWRPLPGRIKDYIAVPKPNGYKSIHTTIFTGDGGIVEIQIKTEEMYQNAEYGIAAHISYKEGLGEKMLNLNFMWILNLIPFRNGNNKKRAGAAENGLSEKEIGGVKDVPNWIKELVEYQKGTANQEKFVENLKTDFLQYRIFVLTPKGDVIDLPIDSSPVDFAYAIHSDIGDHMAGVKVNGKLVPLNTTLKNTDIVEILTKPKNHPSYKWLEFAKTTIAQKHIRALLNEKS